MNCFPLQDWITISGASTITSVTQDPGDWLDLSPFQDIVLWLEVRNVIAPTTTLTMFFDTAPSRDESSFVPMGSVTPLTASATPVVSKFLSASATQPLAQWFRWRLSAAAGATGSWSATLRLWVAANYSEIAAPDRDGTFAPPRPFAGA